MEERSSPEAMEASLDRLSSHAELQTSLLETISTQMKVQGMLRLIQFQSQSLLAIVSGYLAALGISNVLGVWALNQLSGWGQKAMAMLLVGLTVFLLDQIFEIYRRFRGISSHANQILEEMLSKELGEDKLEQLWETVKADTTQKKNWLRRVLLR